MAPADRMSVLGTVRELISRRRHSAGAPGELPDAASQAPAGRVEPPAAALPRDVLCRAPWASLYMDPRGEVKVCCQNEWLRLGNVEERSLLDIWHGEELDRLRGRILEGDLGLGCEMCAAAVERGAGDAAYFHAFDHLPVDPSHIEWPLQLELALSNTCNLQCVMCNGELSSAIRVRREGREPLQSPYGERFFEELDRFLPHVRAITFLGGEPFLARESLRVMERLVELGLTPYCSVTTNGTVLNDRVRGLIERLPMDIAVSIDGTTPATVESVRVGVDHQQLMRNVESIRRAVADRGRMRFSYCSMLPTWSELGGFLEWADELDVDVYVNAVHHPPHLSFAHCPIAELEAIVDAMHSEDGGRRDRLGRNRQVWIDQLESVSSLLRQRLSAPASGPAMGDAVTTMVAIAPRAVAASSGSASNSDSVAVAESVIRADERQLVTEVVSGAAPLHGVDLDSLVGRSLWETVRLITGHVGDLESSSVRRTDDGTEVRQLRFSSPAGPVELTATMHLATAGGGPTWILRFERPAQERPGQERAADQRRAAG